MLNVTIDGQKLQVKEGTTILEACELVGVEIPTLCHLKHLAPEGSCRMCVVEVEGARDLKVSCATVCSEGMNITTMNEKIHAWRRFIVEMLLADHNIDCFSCSDTGKCKLYQYALDYGIREPRFKVQPRDWQIDDTNRFFDYDPHKCILCRRCVRVCNDRQVNHTLNLSGRGIDTVVGMPFNELFIDSNCVSCGNCVSVCPTGALATKASKNYRSWELAKTRTTCSYCAVGCQMDLLVKKGKVVGVEPADGHSNKGLLCVKGKFAYKFIDHPDRLTTPLIRKDGELQPASWDEALDYVVDNLQKIKTESGPDAIAGFSSSRTTNEDNYAFMKMMRGAIGTNSVDNCARV